MVLPFSGKRFGYLYERCDQLSFLDGHVRALRSFGGRPERVVYDNLKAAVKRRTLGEVELSDRFRALASHYVFEPCFARPGEGHDKGSVEAHGKSVRLRHLVPILHGESVDELTSALSAHLDGETSQAWEVERPPITQTTRLAPLPLPLLLPLLLLLLLLLPMAGTATTNAAATTATTGSAHYPPLTANYPLPNALYPWPVSIGPDSVWRRYRIVPATPPGESEEPSSVRSKLDQPDLRRREASLFVDGQG